MRRNNSIKQVVLQSAKTNWTEYRALVLCGSKLHVVEITDTTDTGRDEAWVSNRHVYTQRARQVFKVLAHQKGYWNMRKSDFRGNGIHPDDFANTLLPILSNGEDLSIRDYDKWCNLFTVPLTTKAEQSKWKADDDEVPF